MANGNSNNPFYNFGQILQQQFKAGDNDLTSLDLAVGGKTVRYGQLGAFASQFDQSAERSYTEEGSFGVDQFNPKPKQLDILMQEPEATVFVKKRAFGSLDENYKLDLLDKRERLFVKATKILFQNKCNQISSYEKLTKLARVAESAGRLDEYLLPILFTLVDNISYLPNVLGVATSGLSSFANIVNKIRTIVNLSVDNQTTTWITNVQNNFRSNFGEGTGVIELTNLTSLNTTTSVKFGQGRFSFSISDPYELMLITNADIDQAISDATNVSSNSDFFQLGVSSLNDTIGLNKQLLNENRRARNVAPITFVVQPDTFLGQRVIALIDGIGDQLKFNGSVLNVTLDPSALQGSAELGNEGLSANEASLFSQIVQQYFTQISLNENSRNRLTSFNKDPNVTEVRKKLRLHYANKLIIQPMDTINVYIRSNKKIDNKITNGLQNSFNAGGFLQSSQDLVGNITEAFGFGSNFPIEKAVFLGDPNFPNWLWMIFRNWFMSENEGVHVFGGVVEEATSSFNGGFFSVSASGSDNAGFFKYGVVNIKPSVNVYNGPLYDPLTPFNIKFDSVTGLQKEVTPELLDENKKLFSSAFIRTKNGPDAGNIPTAEEYLIIDAERQKNTKVTKVFYDPDGMVYRWKEGIGTLVGFGDSYEPIPSVYGSPALTQDPFAGQDIMNVLSLLITGQPYNYATFYKAAMQFDTFKRDPVTGDAPSNSYFRNLTANLKYRNLIYGNFIPFKTLTMDDATFSKIIGNVLNAQAFDSDLQSLLQQRASVADKLVSLTDSQQGQSAGGPSPAMSQQAQQLLAGLDTQIQNKINKISSELSQANKPITILGDDISFDYNAALNPGSQTRLDDTQREQLRKKIGFLTRRLSWKVRANEDVNFLIVDDTYDKDYDLQAFEQAFTNPDTFKSEYLTVADKISTVAAKLDLEVFSNSQGHIEIRNPKYNRIPSSVFFKMFRRNDDLGIKVFPQFLEDLYANQLQSLIQEIEVIEDEIRLYCLALGDATDAKCVNRINGAGSALGASIAQITNFMFLSDEATGKISGNLSKSIIDIQSNPDQLLSTITTTLLPSIEAQTAVNAFDVGIRSNIIQSNSNPPPTLNNSSQFANLQQVLSSNSSVDRQTLIINRLQAGTGQTFNFNQIKPASIGLNTVSSMDLLRITNEIASRLSQRQNAIKAAAKALKNTKEILELAQDGTGSNRNVLPKLYTSNTIPQVFSYFIEDESFDDLGPGSGKRYIIKNHDILSYSISERKPPFTSVTVTGRLGSLFISNSQFPPDLQLGNNGTLVTSTTAVDYDLWRMYGISLPQDVDAPFILNPETQAPVYAVALLNKARKQILSGSLEIVGNEYQQPGEIVYLENRDLLFYIESVTHNFNYGRGFTTSLSIGYGHNPGEFIPTALDAIGRFAYKNKDITTFSHKRQGNVFNQEHVGTIAGDYTTNMIAVGISGALSSPTDDITSGPYKEANNSTIQKIIDYASSTLSTASDSYKPILEIRIYYNSKSNFNISNSYAESLANALSDLLLGTSKAALPSMDPSNNPPPSLAAYGPSGSQQVVVKIVDSSVPANYFRYPSRQAYFYGRDIAYNLGNSDLDQNSIDNAIYNFVVDCWVVFNDPNNQTT